MFNETKGRAMKANALTAANVRLFRVWGPDDVPVFDLAPGTPVFVVWSPIHARHIMSITMFDYRYDSFVEAYHFRPDPSLELVEGKEDGPSYYLNKMRSGKLGVA